MNFFCYKEKKNCLNQVSRLERLVCVFLSFILFSLIFLKSVSIDSQFSANLDQRAPLQ